MNRKSQAGSHRVAFGGPVLEVFLTFLRLGATSFGGPMAHIGYFRRAFVERRAWVSEAAYADLVALAQFLPGPASSQVGFALGVMRAGILGGVAAWLGFTLPSAVLMLAAADVLPVISRGPVGMAVIHGLKITAVAVVAQALLGMARSLTPDRARAGIALVAGLVILVLPAALSQIAAITVGGLLGMALCQTRDAPPVAPQGQLKLPARVTPICIGLFVMLFLPGGWVGVESGPAQLFHRFYSAGALVFGGGHVVLPLLREQVVSPGWVGSSQFLSGYGLAQAMPGPLFSLAAFLGGVASVGGGGWSGGLIALVAIFLPGLLLMLAMLPHWPLLRQHPRARSVMKGVNGAIVGILALAFYDPVWTSAVHSAQDFGLAGLGLVLLLVFDTPPLVVVLTSVAGAILIQWGRTGV